MSPTMSVEEVQARFKEVIGALRLGEEIVITENHEPVAKLIGQRAAQTHRPAPGAGKGSIVYMAPDFDEPMDEIQKSAL